MTPALCRNTERPVVSGPNVTSHNRKSVGGIAAGSRSRSWRNIAVSSSHEAVGVCSGHRGYNERKGHLPSTPSCRLRRRTGDLTGDNVGQTYSRRLTVSAECILPNLSRFRLAASPPHRSFKDAAHAYTYAYAYTPSVRPCVRASVRPCVPPPVDSLAVGQLHLLCTIDAARRRAAADWLAPTNERARPASLRVW